MPCDLEVATPLFLIAVLIGVAVRLLLRRGVKTLLPERGPRALAVAIPVLAVLAQLVAEWVAADAVRAALVIGSHLAITAWAVGLAWHAPRGIRAATWGIAAGCTLNAVPVLRYGAMPVSRSALRRIGADPSLDVSQGHLAKHITLAHGRVADVLGDVIPLRVLASVVSVGDLAIAAGLCAVIIGYRPRQTSYEVSSGRHEHGPDRPFVSDADGPGGGGAHER